MSNSSSGPPPGGDEPVSNGRLDSWKEIAAYLRRSVRSAKRWEKEEQLPVHRHMHGKRDSVYAYRTELDEWWSNRGAKLNDENGVEEIAPEQIAPVLDEPQPVALAATAEEPKFVEKAPILPKRTRTAALFSLGLFLALLAATVWLSNRNPGRASRSPVPFKVRDWVLVTSFENRTGRPILDGTLDYALQRELSNSRYVNVVPRERIGDVLRLMRKPLDTRVDAAVGREVCLRDGEIRALITGRIEKLGPRYLLSVELVDPSQGASIASVAEAADRDEELLLATRRISDRVRAMLGENLPSIHVGDGNLLKVTTPSLRALQLYSQADALIAQGDSPAAEELLKQAVTEDPTFASAHIHLAWAIRNQHRPEEEWRPHAETAFGLSESTAERERYFIRGSYYHLLGQNENAIAAYRALLALYPDHVWGTGNLVAIYSAQGRFEDALETELHRADLRPKDFQANCDTAYQFALSGGDLRRATIYVERARAVAPEEDLEKSAGAIAWLELFPAFELWSHGRIRDSVRAADRVASKVDSLSGPARGLFADYVGSFYLTLGRLRAAEDLFQKNPDTSSRLEQLSRLALARGDSGALQRHLQALGQISGSGEWGALLFARAGLSDEALRIVAEKGTSFRPGWAQTVRGEVARARGKNEEAIRLLEEGTQRYTEWTGWYKFFVGSESLAAALREKRNLPEAVRVLERVSENRNSAGFERGGALWLTDQFLLSRLYREVGRDQDAKRIEDDLGTLLAFADADHPIVRALKRLSASDRTASSDWLTTGRVLRAKTLDLSVSK